MYFSLRLRSRALWYVRVRHLLDLQAPATDPPLVFGDQLRSKVRASSRGTGSAIPAPPDAAGENRLLRIQELVRDPAAGSGKVSAIRFPI